MNRSKFLEIIENNGASDPAMIGELSEIISLFPYFQTAHMLLLRELKNNDDVRFGSQLRNSALFIADRAVLYEFLQESRGVSDVQHEPVSPEIPSESFHDDIVPIPEEPALPLIEATDTEQTVIDSARNSNELIAEIENDADETIIDEPDEEEKHELDIINLMDEEFEVTPGLDSIVSSGQMEELLELDVADDMPTEDVPEEPFTKPMDNGLSQADIIDRFIISNPRIEPNREKKEGPVEDRSIPVYDESGFVTETLAGIYITQGYYSRAIDIFEKLALKYPEKSSYFAAQIEKVKENLKK